MSKINIYQVDTFTDKLFSGNPAAVCILQDWLSDELMQSISAENNLAETAFVVPRDNYFEIRWFTPTVEVDLCGHATLAAAFVLFNCLNYSEPEIVFFSTKSGELKVSLQKDILFLDFPTDVLLKADNFTQISNCIGIKPKKIFKGKTDYIAVVDNEDDVVKINPNLLEISKLKARGLIVTSKGKEVDFVSRFFAPQSGINEDPVTGSAHTSLIPIWSQQLGKEKMFAKQLSKRGGSLICVNKGERSQIGGNARLYMTGKINLD